LQDFAGEFQDFVAKKLALISLAFGLFCMASYETVMYSLVYWTGWKDSSGAYGGVLDYRFLGISTVFHVTVQNVQAQALFVFPDFTSYLLIALIILNLLAVTTNWQKLSETTLRDLAVANIVLSTLCILSYVWPTMLRIAELLNRHTFSPGGILQYTPLFGFFVYHVSSGVLESTGVGGSLPFGDWTFMLLIVIIILNLIVGATQQRSV